MMNLSEFLGNWASNTQIKVESEEKMLFRGKAGDISEALSCRYWIPEGSVSVGNEIRIPVEHEDEVNRKIKEQNRISYSTIWENIRNDAKISAEIKGRFDVLIKAANHYVYYRKNWGKFSVEALGRLNEERTMNHNIFISELDLYADLIEKLTGNRVPWRKALGDDRHHLGEFAEYIVDAIQKTNKRIEIFESLKWAQEHQNQIYYLFDNAVDYLSAKSQLMKLYNFSEDQACAITDMRIRVFCNDGKEKICEEISELLEQKNCFQICR